MSKQRFYVVLKGRKPGIYYSWEECNKQVHGFKDAKYRRFDSRIEAELAYAEKDLSISLNYDNLEGNEPKFIEESIIVNAIYSDKSQMMEYQGIDTKTSQLVFHFGPVSYGSENVGKFLAIAHALDFLKKNGRSIPIYCDSTLVISSINKGEINTTIPRSKSTMLLWNLIDWAEELLQKSTFSNEILKWEDKIWGPIKTFSIDVTYNAVNGDSI